MPYMEMCQVHSWMCECGIQGKVQPGDIDGIISTQTVFQALGWNQLYLIVISHRDEQRPKAKPWGTPVCHFQIATHLRA